MAVRSNGWRVESMIAAAHEVDQTIMVANNTHQLARNADLNIHFGPKEANKPWLDAESTPRKEPSGYWGKFSKESHQVPDLGLLVDSLKGSGVLAQIPVALRHMLVEDLTKELARSSTLKY